MDLIDINRAHFNAKPKEPNYVEIPPERARPGFRARLRFNLYGTRGAAAAWEEHYASLMESWGIARGRSSPCLFVHPQRGLLVVVHGDDFHNFGPVSSLDWFKSKLTSVYLLKHRARLGTEPGDDSQARVLNRIVEVREDEVRIEADQRHVEIAVREMDLERGRGVPPPPMQQGEHPRRRPQQRARRF